MFKYIFLFIMLSFPASAATVEWMELKPDGTVAAATSAPVGTLGSVQRAAPGKFYYYAPTSADITTDSSAVIDVRACGGSGPSIIAWPDVDGINFTGEAFVYACPGIVWNATKCIKLLVDIDGGGVDNVSLDGDDGTNRDADATAQQRAWMSGVSFPLIAVHHTVDSTLDTAAAGDPVRIDLFCAQP